MSFPEPPPPGRDGDQTERLWSAPEGLAPPAQRTGARRGVLSAALAVLGLAAAGVTGAVLVRGGDDPEAALAASSSTPSPSATDDGDSRGHAFGHRFHGGPLGGLGGMAGAVHGELVVPDGEGGWTTMVVQRGTATAVGSDSITVKSDDNWTRTYDVPAGTGVNAQRDGLDSIDEGDNVVVMAERSGDGLTARQIVDLDAIADGMPFGFERHGRGLPGAPDLDGDDEAPAPAPSGSTEGTAARV